MLRPLLCISLLLSPLLAEETAVHDHEAQLLSPLTAKILAAAHGVFQASGTAVQRQYRVDRPEDQPSVQYLKFFMEKGGKYSLTYREHSPTDESFTNLRCNGELQWDIHSQFNDEPVDAHVKEADRQTDLGQQIVRFMAPDGEDLQREFRMGSAELGPDSPERALCPAARSMLTLEAIVPFDSGVKSVHLWVDADYHSVGIETITNDGNRIIGLLETLDTSTPIDPETFVYRGPLNTKPPPKAAPPKAAP